MQLNMVCKKTDRAIHTIKTTCISSELLLGFLMFFKHDFNNNRSTLKQDLCHIPTVWLLLLCGKCLNVKQLSLSQLIPAVHKDAIIFT